MKKSSIIPLPNFFDRYILLVEKDLLFEAFEASIREIDALDINKLQLLGDKTYEVGKWSVKDILQHIIDTERIQAYRALRFARKDTTVLPGFDEDLYGTNANASKRSVQNLIRELKLVRKSSMQLFKSFEEDALQNSGICYGQNISVLALAFVIIGHQIHHVNFIEKNYFPLLNGEFNAQAVQQ